MKKTTCSKCELPIDGSHPNYCNACFTAYHYYRRHTDEPFRLRTVARTKAMDYLKKGIIIHENCRLCGSKESEMHHPDYKKPYDVSWLCKKCHHELHSLERIVFA